MTVNEERHGSIPIHLLYEDDLDQWRTAQDESTRNWSAANCFKAERGKQLVIPGSQGRPVAVLVGLGRRNPREELSCWAAAAIPDRLPDGDYHLAETLPARLATQFAFGWAYGQYKFERYRRANPQRAVHLRPPPEADAAEVARLRAATVARARSHQHAGQRHVAGSTGAGRDRGRATLWRPTSGRHRRRPAQGTFLGHSRSGTRSGRGAAARRHRMGRSFASEGQSRRQGRVLRFRRARHQARRVDAADEEGHGRRRRRARARAARDGCEAAGASAPAAAGSGERDLRQRVPSGRRARHAQGTDGRDRQHRRRRSRDSLRCARARRRREARSADRLRRR